MLSCPYPRETAIRQRALKSLGHGESLVRRILRVRFARLGAICLSVEARLYAHGASIKCWKARAGVLLLSQNLEFVRVLDTLKHTLAKSDWCASHRKARTRDFLFLLGDFHGRRKSFTIIIYPLCNTFVEIHPLHIKISCLKHAFLNRFHPQRFLHCYLLSTLCQWTAALRQHHAQRRRGQWSGDNNSGEQ